MRETRWATSSIDRVDLRVSRKIYMQILQGCMRIPQIIVINLHRISMIGNHLLNLSIDQSVFVSVELHNDADLLHVMSFL